MNSISITTTMTFQQSVVNSITQNLDMKAAICLYMNNNINRSKLIASKTFNSYTENVLMPDLEQESDLGYDLRGKIDQKFSNFRSILK